MKKLLSVLFLLFCAVVLNAAQPRVAVMALENKSAYRGEGVGLGDGMADMLVTSLVQSKKFKVVERAEMEKILKEQAFTLSGVVNPQTAAQVGKILGVDFMIIGSVNEFGTTSSELGAFGVGMKNHVALVGLDIRAISVNTAEIAAAATGQGKKSKKAVSVSNADIFPTDIKIGSDKFATTLIGQASREAVDNAVKKVAEDIGGAGQISIIKIANGVVFINVGKNDGVKPGDTYKVIRLGEAMTDPDTGESLGADTSEVGVIKITEVLDKFSKASIVKGEGILQTDKVKK